MNDSFRGSDVAVGILYGIGNLLVSDNCGIHLTGKNNLIRYVTVEVVLGRCALFPVRLPAHDGLLGFADQRNHGRYRIGIDDGTFHRRAVAVCIRNRVVNDVTFPLKLYAVGDVSVIVVNGCVAFFLVGSAGKREITFLRQKRDDRSFRVRYLNLKVLRLRLLSVPGRYNQRIFADLIPVDVAADFRGKLNGFFLVHAGRKCLHLNFDAFADREFVLQKCNRNVELIIPVFLNSPECRCRNGKAYQGNQNLFHFLTSVSKTRHARSYNEVYPPSTGRMTPFT